MKRILLLTLIAAAVALLGGCATTDYSTEDNAPHEDNRSRIMDTPMNFGHGDSGGGGGGGY
ncbi:MAG TPA: hypothetical protein VNV15_05625 [Opitutaceae bacterium]|jgi:hypothetical protein|nr:hypothetical protein [Opitutaceae bacterium]